MIYYIIISEKNQTFIVSNTIMNIIGFTKFAL